MSWTARLLIALTLLLIGAAIAIWALANYQTAARLLGVAPTRDEPVTALAAAQPQQQPAQIRPPPAPAQPADPAALETQVTDLQARLRRVENAAAEARGSAGRADALLIAFAARRAIDRGVALGYLEPLLIDRFGVRHPQAVATVVTASRTPVRLADLIDRYEELQPQLLAAAPNEGFWTGLKRQVGSLVSIRRASEPSTQPEARYRRAMANLSAGEVDAALAETMRLPGAPRAGDWIASARQYVAAHRALDEIESAALLNTPAPR